MTSRNQFRDAMLYFLSMCFAAAIGWVIWGPQISNFLRYERVKENAIMSDISYDIDVITSGTDDVVQLTIYNIVMKETKYCTVLIESDDKLIYYGSVAANTIRDKDFSITLCLTPEKPKAIFSIMVLQHDYILCADETVF
jgi:hypothetical protein